MLNTDYLALLQDKYTSTYSTGLNNLSDLSSLLANSKTDASKSDYAQKIVDVASADAQNDIKNGNNKSWQNSEDYLNLKDEYVSSGMSTGKTYSTYEDIATQFFRDAFKSIFSYDDDDNENFMTKLNKRFAEAMNQTVTKTVRETEFDLKYNYAYSAYKTSYAANQLANQASLDITV